MRSFPHYHQLDSSDCGPTCLRMIARHYGRSYTLETLRERSFITREGVSMLGISDAAESIGMRTMGVKISVEQLAKEAVLPCILHWNQNHFVVLYKASKRRGDRYVFHIADPASQKVALENSSLILNCKRSKIQNEQAETQAKTQRFLEASLSVNVGWHQVADNFRGVYKGLLNEQSALVNVTIPLADFGRRKTQLAQIRENIELDIINEKKATDNLIEEVVGRVSYMTINRRKVNSCAETYELAQMFYKEALESYKLGRSPFSKVCEALIRQNNGVGRLLQCYAGLLGKLL